MYNNYLLDLNGFFPLIEWINYITCSPAFVLKLAWSVAGEFIPQNIVLVLSSSWCLTKTHVIQKVQR